MAKKQAKKKVERKNELAEEIEVVLYKRDMEGMEYAAINYGERLAELDPEFAAIHKLYIDADRLSREWLKKHQKPEDCDY